MKKYIHRKAHNSNSKARQRGFEGRLDKDDVWGLFSEQGGVCSSCGIGLSPDNCHLDHMVPLSHGGHHELGNMQFLCKGCHREKSIAEVRGRDKSIETRYIRVRIMPDRVCVSGYGHTIEGMDIAELVCEIGSKLGAHLKLPWDE